MWNYWSVCIFKPFAHWPLKSDAVGQPLVISDVICCDRSAIGKFISVARLDTMALKNNFSNQDVVSDYRMSSSVSLRPGGLFFDRDVAVDTVTERPPWWRHQMETFSALLALCAGNSPVTGEFPAQRPVTRSFDVIFDQRLNKELGEQSWSWWFGTPSRPLWRHCNVPVVNTEMKISSGPALQGMN